MEKLTFKSITILLIIFFFFLCTPLFAVNFEMGYDSTLPKIWAGPQKYKYLGEKITKEAKVVDLSEKGNNYHFRMLFSFLGVDWQYSNISYKVILGEDDVFTTETTGFARVSTMRYGLSLHLRGEIASAYFGGGQSQNSESIDVKGDNGRLTYKGTSTYVEWGLRLYFGPIAAGYSYLRLREGANLITVGALQLIFVF